MMKKYPIILCLLSVVWSVSAQIELTATTNSYYGNFLEVGQELDASWDVINTSSQNLEIRCSRQALEEVSGSDGNFCWGFICTAWSTGNLNTSEVVYLAPGESTNTFHAKYRHHGNEGQSSFNYCFWNVNPDVLVDQVCYQVNFIVNDGTVSTSDELKIEGRLDLSPNPLVKMGSITYGFNQMPSNGKLIIYSSIGSLVREIKLSNREGIVFLNADDFDAGIYFCALENAGSTVKTQRLVIQ